MRGKEAAGDLLDAAYPGKVVCECAMIKFQDLDSFTTEDIEAAIRRNAPDELPLVPITVALLSRDPAEAAGVCVRLAVHDNPRVRGNALAALGHVARRFRKLDEPLIRPIIEAGLQADDDHVRASARSAADEVHQFLHWTIAGHVYG